MKKRGKAAGHHQCGERTPVRTLVLSLLTAQEAWAEGTCPNVAHLLLYFPKSSGEGEGVGGKGGWKCSWDCRFAPSWLLMGNRGKCQDERQSLSLQLVKDRGPLSSSSGDESCPQHRSAGRPSLPWLMSFRRGIDTCEALSRGSKEAHLNSWSLEWLFLWYVWVGISHTSLQEFVRQQ